MGLGGAGAKNLSVEISVQLARNIGNFFISGPKAKAPTDWKRLHGEVRNKTQFSKSSYAKGCTVEKYILHLIRLAPMQRPLKKGEKVFTTQEKANTISTLHCMHKCETAPSTTQIGV